jgi:hypothetical protein
VTKCKRCHQAHPRCAAHNRAGKPCGKSPIKGGTVCSLHGGKAPQTIAKADRRVAHEIAVGQLGALLAEMGETPTPHPFEGLVTAYAKADRMVRALELLVGEMPSPLGINRFDEFVVHPLTALYGEWVERYARLQKLALDAGIDERRQQMSEAEARNLFAAFRQAIDATGLTPAQEAAFRDALASALRDLDAQPPG